MSDRRNDACWASCNVLLVLGILADGERAGHEGDLSPLLHRLEERGDIRSRERMNDRRPRRWYRLTRQGTKTLARCRREWEHYRRKCSSLAAGGETCARR